MFSPSSVGSSQLSPLDREGAERESEQYQTAAEESKKARVPLRLKPLRGLSGQQDHKPESSAQS